MLAHRPPIRIATILALAIWACDAASAQWQAVRLHSEREFQDSEVYAITPTYQAGRAVRLDQTPGIKPVMWTGASQSWIDLEPPNGLAGQIFGASGSQQVGDFSLRAALWSGTPGSRVDLHVPGYQFSSARATDGVEQAGFLQVGSGTAVAALWHGTAQSVVNLRPAGASFSAAFAVANGQQGGVVRMGGASELRAALWSGSAASMVLLHPGPDFVESEVFGMASGQQVGWARRFAQDDHAGIWHGTAASWTDLDPGYGLSRLLGTCGSAQVGWASTPQSGITAGIWFGTPESFVPLAPYLPAGYFESVATCVAFGGGLYHVGGYAWNATTNQQEAFLWVGIPAPGTSAVLVLAGAALRRRRTPREG